MRDYYYPGLDTLASQIRDCVQRHGFTTPGPGNMSEKLMLVGDELSEAHEEHRDGYPLGYIYFLDTVSGEKLPGNSENTRKFQRDPMRYKPEGFAIECIDAVIRLFDILEGIEVSAATCMSLKMRFNETRPPKHGRNL